MCTEGFSSLRRARGVTGRGKGNAAERKGPGGWGVRVGRRVREVRGAGEVGGWVAGIDGPRTPDLATAAPWLGIFWAAVANTELMRQLNPRSDEFSFHATR